MTPAEHVAVQAAIEALANRDLTAVWRSLDLSDARQATALLLPQTRDVVSAYAELAATSAADFYDTARETAGVRGRFVASPAAIPPVEQIDVLTRWAVTPLWSSDPRAGAALVKLAGGAQRLIRKAERDTITGNAGRDPADARYVRVPRSDACAFCLMLGSRGPVYDAESAREVVGRGVRRWDRPGRRGPSRVVGRVGGRRGSRHLGEPYHDHCRCETRPVWTPGDIPEINRRLADEWDTVTSGQPEQLDAWRAHVDATRPNQHQVRT